MMFEHNDSSRENVATTRLQPMGFTGILDGTFSLYRNHFGLFFRIVLVYFVIMFCLNLLSRFFLEVPDVSGLSPEDALFASIALLVNAFIFTVITTIPTLLVVAGIDFAGAQCYLGRPITLGDVFRQVLRRFWPYLGYIFLWYLVVGALTVTFIGIPFAIYLAVRWGFGSLPILFEETKVRTALRRSSELVKGTWWRVFGISLAIFLLWWMLLFILQTSVGFVLTLIGVPTADNIFDTIRRILEGAHTLDSDFHDQPFSSYAINALSNLSIMTLMLPVLPIGFMLLYFDLRIRKEGFDIEMMARSEQND